MLSCHLNLNIKRHYHSTLIPFFHSSITCAYFSTFEKSLPNSVSQKFSPFLFKNRNCIIADLPRLVIKVKTYFSMGTSCYLYLSVNPILYTMILFMVYLLQLTSQYHDVYSMNMKGYYWSRIETWNCSPNCRLQDSGYSNPDVDTGWEKFEKMVASTASRPVQERDLKLKESDPFLSIFFLCGLKNQKVCHLHG